MSGSRWEHFAHDADVGVSGEAPTLAGAFEQAALAMTAVVTEPGGVRAVETVAVECDARDPEMLLVAWLDAIVYEMATRGLVFGDFEVEIEGDRLRGTLRGEPVDAARHGPAVEVKGATYTELSVRQQLGGTWRARCVVDV